MDKKSKILIIIFITILLGSVALTYRRTIIEQNFDTEASEETEDQVLETI